MTDRQSPLPGDSSLFVRSFIRRRAAAVVMLPLSLLLPLSCLAQSQSRSVTSHALPDGLEVTAGDTVLRVSALRDDVLRIRMYRGQLPEDASWAVLPTARTASLAVAPEQVEGAYGFHTASLRVRIDDDLRLTVTDLAGDVLQQDAAPVSWTGTRFRISKEKTADDHFFGLGDKPGPLDRAGEVFTMWNTDSFGWQESTDPIYKSVPFFIEMHAGRALGVLVDNTFRSTFDFGKESPDRYSFTAPDGPIDYYLLYGPAPKQVVEDYAWLTGPTPLPPLWSLGFQQSRYTYEPESRLMEVAKRLRDDHIPADAVWLDIDFQEKNRPFTVDEIKFPRFPEMVQTLAKEHFHLVVITDLHIAKVPNAGYAPYDSGTAGDHFVKNPDGSTYVGPVWPGPAVFPDFTRQQTRAWWGTLYKQFTADGVAGFWNDMNEPAVFVYPTKTMPDNVQHRIDEPGFKPRTAAHLEIHNIFGMENSRATYDGVLQLRPNVRPFVLTRASYAGGQRYAATWTGDNSSTWNHLRQTIPQLLNLGLSGFAMSGADVGGFAGSPPADLLTKWLEIAAFQPIDRDHAAKGTRDHEPWVDGPEQEAIRRRYIEERYRLMPYLYTTAEEMSRTGLPIMRPLFLEFPNAADGYFIDPENGGEFFFGPDLLIASNPSPEEIAPYEVRLPPGIWYDYWTGEKLDRRARAGARDLEIRDNLTAAKPLMITPRLADLPIYVREGSIIPIAPLTQSTEEKPNGPLTLRVYAGKNCHGDLYQDDGTSFDFRRGSYFRRHFSCEEQSDGSLTVSLAAPEGSFKPWWSEVRFEVIGWTPRTKQLTTPSGSTPLAQSNHGWTATVKDTDSAASFTFH
jgi:alpha-glucosidase